MTRFGSEHVRGEGNFEIVYCPELANRLPKITLKQAWTLIEIERLDNPATTMREVASAMELGLSPVWRNMQSLRDKGYIDFKSRKWSTLRLLVPVSFAYIHHKVDPISDDSNTGSLKDLGRAIENLRKNRV